MAPSSWCSSPYRALTVGLGVLLLTAFVQIVLPVWKGSSNHKQRALAMSLGAGMATGIGASAVFFTTSLDKTLLACTMAFSAGVMLYVSFVEVLGVAEEYYLQGDNSPSTAYAYATLSVFAGVLLMAVVDKLVHLMFEHVAGGEGGHEDKYDDAATATANRGREGGSGEHGRGLGRSLELGGSSGGGGGGGGGSGGGNLALNGGSARVEVGAEELSLLDRHGHNHGHDCGDDDDHDHGEMAIKSLAAIKERNRLLMMSSVISAAIVLHNIPEGMATYVASFHSVSAGAPLAIAIAIHNIPEGLAVAMPIYYATKSKVRAVMLGTLSGMSEPFGALLASLVANKDSSPNMFGGMFGLTGGMMTFVCVAELLPAAYGEKGVSRGTVTAAFFAGCFVMASSLVIEKYATAASKSSPPA